MTFRHIGHYPNVSARCVKAIGVFRRAAGSVTERRSGADDPLPKTCRRRSPPGTGDLCRESAILRLGLLRVGPNGRIAAEHQSLVALIDDGQQIGVCLERLLSGEQA